MTGAQLRDRCPLRVAASLRSPQQEHRRGVRRERIADARGRRDRPPGTFRTTERGNKSSDERAGATKAMGDDLAWERIIP